MATFDWNNLNQQIKISYTKKKFFNKFYFRLNYFVPGGRIATQGEREKIPQRVFQFNNKEMFWARLNYYDADEDQILDFHDFYQSVKTPSMSEIKIRIESYNFSIYSTSESELYKIAETSLSKWKSSIRSVCLISDPGDYDLLDQGHILVTKPQTHPYRVQLKEGFNYTAERQALASYLKNLGDHVRITTFMLSRLGSPSKYFPGGTLHFDDERLVNLIQLIAPNVVGRVNKLIYQ